MDKLNILTICDRNTANLINNFDFINKHFFIENPRERNKNDIKLSETVNFKIENYRKFKFGTFANQVNWDEIPPLDGYILECMSRYESYALKMYERVANIKTELYESRKIQYLNNLRYWNYFLDNHKIDVFFEYAPPHIGFDYIIYQLCKLKNIKTFNFIKMYKVGYLIDDIQHIFDDYDLLLLRRNIKIKKLKTMYEDHKNKMIPQNKKDKPLVVPNARAQKKITRRNLRTINHLKLISNTPDLNKKYIYFPLHYQPEGTTTPMGGYFTDQILALEILSRLGINIYVKEHPRMSKNRSIAYYNKINRLKNVSFINTNYSTYELIDNAFTTAVITGTAAFESILRGKTALMFGNSFLKYAPGVSCVKSLKEAKQSIEKIKNFKHNDEDLKYFLSNLENNFLFDFINFDESYVNLTAELKFKIMGYMQRKETQKRNLDFIMAQPCLEPEMIERSYDESNNYFNDVNKEDKEVY